MSSPLSTPEDLAARLERLPPSPGVYLMHDRKGRLLYVGKAQNLRQRVRQYFNGSDDRLFVPRLASIVGDIQTIVTSNSKEALLLENNLIKEKKPRFNVKLRDDKQYLVLRLDPKASWPRLEVVRNMRGDHAYYFGPYHSAQRARSTLRVINRYFKLRTCSDYVLRRRQRPCLEYQIKRCPAPCVLEVDKDEYGHQVQQVRLFLEGRHRELVEDLRRRMQEAAQALEFESAARLRDQLSAIESTLAQQKVVSADLLDLDVVGMYREGGQVDFSLLNVRSGKVLGFQAFSQRGMELPDAALIHSFVRAYYELARQVPDEVLLPLPIDPEHLQSLHEMLREKRGRKLRIYAPLRGEKTKLVSLAQKNAASNFVSRRNRERDAEQLLENTQKKLRLRTLPRRIECFDISHFQGREAVASMVVFVDGVSDSSQYRSFKIRGRDGTGTQFGQNDDFASMYEALSRRLRRALDDPDTDWRLPDLIVIDGGKGQLGSALAAARDLDIELSPAQLEIVSLAKDPDRIFLPNSKEGIVLKPGSSEHFLLTQLRDEAHRFAITHHRKKRQKRGLQSELDEIPGVGPAMKKKLLLHFKSVKALREAQAEDLQAVPGVGPAMAKRLKEALS